jgi:phosphatidate cytidylyltransferase
VINLLLVWFCFSLKRGALRYQFDRAGLALIAAPLCAINTTAVQQFYSLGVFWSIFVPIVISCNDAFAYFCGRSFGKTSLIRLSPNKTWEGFVGGGVVTFAFIVCLMGSIFGNEKVSCANFRVDLMPFEEVHCFESADNNVF